jgi:nucleoside-diphosphate-sugar epimerase
MSNAACTKNPVDGLILKPESGLLKQLLPVFKLGGGGPLAGGDQYMPWIHIDDEVGLILWALDTVDISGPVNAAAPNPVTNRTFSKLLGKALKRPAFFPRAQVRRHRHAWLRGRRLRHGKPPRDASSGTRRGLHLPFPELEPALRDLLGK